MEGGGLALCAYECMILRGLESSDYKQLDETWAAATARYCAWLVIYKEDRSWWFKQGTIDPRMMVVK